MRRCTDPPEVWLNASTATIYRHTFGPAWGEDGEIGGTPEVKDEFSIEVARAWECAFLDAETPETRKITLRSAMVLGLGVNSVFPALRRMTRLGLGGAMAKWTAVCFLDSRTRLLPRRRMVDRTAGSRWRLQPGVSESPDECRHDAGIS